MIILNTISVSAISSP